MKPNEIIEIQANNSEIRIRVKKYLRPTSVDTQAQMRMCFFIDSLLAWILVGVLPRIL